jgi:hypothetical protein
MCRKLLAAALLLICSKPVLAQDCERHLTPDQGQLGEISAAKNIAVANNALMHAGAAETLSDAREPQTPAPSPDPQTSSPLREQAPHSRTNGSSIIAILPPPISRKRLTAKDKFQIYTHQMFGPQNFILPAFGAGFSMLHPPSRYPREWKDGGGAFGRWYERQIVTSTS